MAADKPSPAPSAPPDSGSVPNDPAAEQPIDRGSLLVLMFYLISFLVVALSCLTGFVTRLWN